MNIATVIVGSLLALAFIAAGLPKVVKAQSALTQAEEVKIAPTSYQIIGVLELLGAAGVVLGLWISWLGVAAGAGLALMMIGAVVTHVRAGQSANKAIPAIAFAALALGYIVLRLLSA
jgi:uncharacterized membrane protein YphA (DoxX/SURF4 family)